MGKGSGAGLIRVGSLGGKIIAALTGAPGQSAPDLKEAFGFRNYTFELLSVDPNSQAALAPNGLAQVEYTNDLATANGVAGATNWSIAGMFNPQAATPQTSVTWDKPAKAFRVNLTFWNSGTFVVSATCVP